MKDAFLFLNVLAIVLMMIGLVCGRPGRRMVVVYVIMTLVMLGSILLNVSRRFPVHEPNVPVSSPVEHHE